MQQYTDTEISAQFKNSFMLFKSFNLSGKESRLVAMNLYIHNKCVKLIKF